jgi:hypothetical protein
MRKPPSFRKGFGSCLARIRRYWPHLVFVLFPVSLLAGAAVASGAEEPVKPASILIGGVVLGFVAGLAAISERCRAFAAGGPFLVAGMVSGAMLVLVGLSRLFVVSVVLSLVATTAGVLTGFVSQREADDGPEEPV